MEMEMTKDHPRPSVLLWIGSYVILLWSVIVHLVDRVLLFLTPTPRSARSAHRSVMTLAALALVSLLPSREREPAPHRNN